MIRAMCSSSTCRKIAQTIWIPYIMCGFLLLYITYSPTNHIQIFQRQEIKLDNGVVEQYTTTQTKSPIDEQRDHIVMGILSANGKQRFRDTQRKTWIKAMLRMQHILPFKITYKFLLDEPSSESIAENALNHDIVYLNVTNHGRAVKFGEKMYIWWKYVHTVYPDALLGGRIDDDAFLCVPQVFYRLDSIKSSNLYYGWRHGKSRQINRDNRVDEMFLFLGRDLMSSISKRHYCGLAKCKNKDDLIDIDFGDTSLAEWLSIYSDKVNFISDNDRIVQCGANSHAIYKKYLKPGFCLKQLVFHKSTYEMIELLQSYNDFAFMEKSKVEQSIKMDVSERTIISGVSGSIFSGDVVRKVPQFSIDKTTTLFSNESDAKICDNWAVVTTIHQPSNSVRNVAKHPSWCVVIVADVTTPSEDAYLKSVVNDENKSRVIYLSINRQKTLYPLLSEVIPVKHFGRKNIGYMFAIHHKAKYIWDFDDDNNGVFDLNEIERLTKGESVTVCNDKGSKLFNPYPYFGVSETRVWPRGFPLESIKDNKTIPQICDTKVSVKVGAIQCLANEQPDVDAIYRFTRNVPFNFSATKETHKPFVVPKQTFSPFNAQATLWTSSAFKYMALPISINGRVSDIWRSYIAQYFFYRSDLRLAFSVPYVVQERNIHSISGDFNAELDIYEKVGALFNLVMNLKDDNLVSVYENLYSRHFIEKSDLTFIKVWMETFLKVTGSNV
ncbi:uncharacterized protein [Mytilus edulis]|uniref:uncharacterized protein isoform X1 n=1 Tax=Mytilus edulis TaxID=6550 RepID=UPI0039EEBED7